jgi:hypothetical protein
MTSTPSTRQLEMLARVSREEGRDRRIIMRIQIAAAALLIASTALAWMSHPGVAYHIGPTRYYYVREMSHSIGVVTRPAGVLALVIGIVALGVAALLRSPRMATALVALVLSFGVLGVCSAEIVQLMLGRRNWQDTLANSVVASPLGNAVGLGVWLATAASVVLVANASTYCWREMRLWRKASNKQ